MERNLLVSWLLTPVILGGLISFVIPIYSYFRFLFILPSFVTLIALGIISFRSKLRYIFLSIVLLIQVFSTFIYLFNPLYHREDWRSLVNFLKLKKDSLVLFESTNSFPPFDYYDKGGINFRGALRNFPAKNNNDLINLESYTKRSNELYLIEYLVDISDPERLVDKNLISLGYKKLDTKDFNGVGFVYHYRKESL